MKNIGFAICGSFCTFNEVFAEIEFLKEDGYNIFPIMSENSYNFDTRFGKASDWQSLLIEITGNQIIHTIPQPNTKNPY